MKLKRHNFNWFAAKLAQYFCFAILALVIFFPFYWIIASSLKTENAIYAVPPELFPKHPTLENYLFSIADSGVLKFSVNSIFVGCSTMFLTIAISVMAVYPLTRMKFKGKKLFFGLLASTQVFPMIITIVPLYIMYRKAHIYNTFASLILTNTATCIPIAIVLLTGYFRDVPRAMEEAGVIDGCNRLRLLLNIIIPTSLPGIVASGIYVFLTVWQEYLASVSLISDRAKYTLTLGLTLFQTEHSTNWGALMATAVILAAPAILLFFGIEKYFIDSLVGSVKE